MSHAVNTSRKQTKVAARGLLRSEQRRLAEQALSWQQLVLH
jgi:hypothetical protein